MTETITLRGNSFTLKGKVPKEGEIAPDCEFVGSDLQSIKLSACKGKPLLLISLPSLDTDMGSQMICRFNKEVKRFGKLIATYCVSVDLPFAQLRWSATHGIKNIVILSDYRYREFGEKYGVLIQELGLLARAIFLLDAEMKIQMTYLMKEVMEDPDYDLVLHRIDRIISPISTTL
jgi:thiol peroxidase